jgi:hypothetical protein
VSARSFVGCGSGSEPDDETGDEDPETEEQNNHEVNIRDAPASLDDLAPLLLPALVIGLAHARNPFPFGLLGFTSFGSNPVLGGLARFFGGLPLCRRSLARHRALEAFTHMRAAVEKEPDRLRDRRVAAEAYPHAIGYSRGRAAELAGNELRV